MSPHSTTAAKDHGAPRDRRSTTIHVCSLSEMPALVERSGARHLVTIINAGMVPETPPGVQPERHLKLVCSDICEPKAGRICPEPRHVADLIGFVRAWDHQSPLLIHCLAGISRSTAAAYIALCALNEHASEHEVAHRLRRASPTAMPNRLLIEYADSALERQGRMLAAIASMAPASLEGCEGRPFSLLSRIA